MCWTVQGRRLGLGRSDDRFEGRPPEDVGWMGSRVGWFVLVELDVGSRADQSERGPG